MIENPNFTVDMEKLLETKSKVVNTLVGGVAGLLRSYGVTVHKGIGTITKDKNVLVNGSELLETKKIILAGGSKVSKINVPGMESPLVMTSDDILEMNEVPESLVIIGGGVVGIELGQAFMTFGSKVTVIEMMDRIVPAMDAEVSKNLRLILERKGMTILTGTKLQEIIEENGQLRIKVEGKDDIIASKALLSIGRMPDLEGIGEVEFELIVVVSRSMNTWKLQFQAFMHQVTSTVLRCWLTQLSAWVKFPLKMPLKEIMQLPN